MSARVAPTDGVPAPVRAQTFYLLRRSLASIRNEIEAQDPAPKMNDFIDGLSVSPELKAWMKQNKTVELAGSGFIKKLDVDAVMGVPEFYTAYMTRNTGYPHSGFPVPKYTEKDKRQEIRRNINGWFRSITTRCTTIAKKIPTAGRAWKRR